MVDGARVRYSLGTNVNTQEPTPKFGHGASVPTQASCPGTKCEHDLSW